MHGCVIKTRKSNTGRPRLSGPLCFVK